MTLLPAIAMDLIYDFLEWHLHVARSATGYLRQARWAYLLEDKAIPFDEEC